MSGKRKLANIDRDDPAPFRHWRWWLLPSFTMFLVLIASLVLYQFVDTRPGLRPIAHLVDIAAVLLVVRLVRSIHTLVSSGWIIAIPNVVLQLWFLLAPSPSIEVAMLSAQMLFHGWAIIALLSYVLADSVVTRDELFALAALYVLLAFFWASGYGLVVHFDPAALAVGATNNPSGQTSFADLVYFSMTTMTSTGYGEITPVAPLARAMAMVQQLTGVLFVAMLISRLATLNRRRGSPDSPD